MKKLEHHVFKVTALFIAIIGCVSLANGQREYQTVYNELREAIYQYNRQSRIAIYYQQVLEYQRLPGFPNSIAYNPTFHPYAEALTRQDINIRITTAELMRGREHRRIIRQLRELARDHNAQFMNIHADGIVTTGASAGRQLSVQQFNDALRQVGYRMEQTTMYRIVPDESLSSTVAARQQQHREVRRRRSRSPIAEPAGYRGTFFQPPIRSSSGGNSNLLGPNRASTASQGPGSTGWRNRVRSRFRRMRLLRGGKKGWGVNSDFKQLTISQELKVINTALSSNISIPTSIGGQKVQKHHIQLFDISGKIISIEEWKQQGNHVLIKPKDVAKGIYLLNITMPPGS